MSSGRFNGFKIGMNSRVSFKKRNSVLVSEGWQNKVPHSLPPYISVSPCPPLPLLPLIKPLGMGLLPIWPHLHLITLVKTLFQNKVTLTGAGVRTWLCPFWRHNSTSTSRQKCINLGCPLYSSRQVEMFQRYKGSVHLFVATEYVSANFFHLSSLIAFTVV